MGIYLAIPPTLNVLGSFVVGRFEKQLLLRGQWGSLRIQKTMSTAGGLVEAVVSTVPYRTVPRTDKLSSPQLAW